MSGPGRPSPRTAGFISLPPLVLAAIGIAYGDIGTSPLYALRESLRPDHGVALGRAAVLGVLSLVFWSLILIISLKYLVLVLRADNEGEGGVLALTSLIMRKRATRRRGLILIGLFATGLLYGDGMITPAISALSAVEGLTLATPRFEPFVIPLAIAILIALFAFQSRGTAHVGSVFGPVMLVWFAVLAALGLWHIADEPAVLAAASPLYAIRFFTEHGARGFLVLGSVVLVVTGGEALYADLGHFGRRPLRMAWFGLVLPALLLNYFGQGALILAHPAAVVNPFFRMVPSFALYPLILLATAATAIASQALVSGAFSLTRQAVQLGYLPRTTVLHTSPTQIGQIYVPTVNWTLMIACIALVLGFGSSANMAAAYGVAVTATMTVSTILFIAYARENWAWPRAAVMLLGAGLLTIDLSFLGANLLKIPSGGWFPLAVGAGMFAIFIAWRAGREALADRLSARGIPPHIFVGDVLSESHTRVPGTAVYMSAQPDSTPPALLHNLMHNKVLHERVVFLSVLTENVPHVPAAGRAETIDLGSGIHQVVLRYGFMDTIDVPAALEDVRIDPGRFQPLETTWFLGRESIVGRPARDGLPRWKLALFRVLSRNATDAAAYFGLPPNRVVELGAQVEL